MYACCNNMDRCMYTHMYICANIFYLHTPSTVEPPANGLRYLYYTL